MRWDDGSLDDAKKLRAASTQTRNKKNPKTSEMPLLHPQHLVHSDSSQVENYCSSFS